MARARPARRPALPEEGSPAWQSLAVGSPLRALLRSLEARVGLFGSPEAEDGSRFRRAVLLSGKHPLPMDLAALFPLELGELRRLGKPVGTCHSLVLDTLRIACLPYYSYDGFNALLGVESAGALLAAWKDAEFDEALSPRTIHIRGSLAQLQALLEPLLYIAPSA